MQKIPSVWLRRGRFLKYRSLVIDIDVQFEIVSPNSEVAPKKMTKNVITQLLNLII